MLFHTAQYYSCTSTTWFYVWNENEEDDYDGVNYYEVGGPHANAINNFRDAIARAMWEDYVAYIQANYMW